MKKVISAEEKNQLGEDSKNENIMDNKDVKENR